MIASAPISASSDSNLLLVLISAGVVLAVGVLGLVVMRLAQSRGRRNRDVLLAVVILWGLGVAGSVSYSIMQQMDWSNTYQQRLASGYGDPRDLSDRPNPPVKLWCGLGACYAGMLGWAGMRSSPK